MTGLFRKAAMILATVLSLAAVPFAGASASTSDTPRIRSITGIMAQSVKLSVFDKQFKNKDVVVKVKIRTMGTGKIMIEKIATKLNTRGQSAIMVGGLKPKTGYTFKIEVRKATSTNFSDYSATKRVTTL